ncbi:MAG: topology modulation protein [Eubacterium sp.]|nr:topology modulation protein [Eubacterium sp.]
MKKIIVIGGNGSGKTTFARQLSKQLDIPLIFIDKIYWTDNWTRADEDTANAVLKSEMQKDKWIIDGNHTSSIPERLKECDTVFYFDFSAFDCLIGSIVRVIKNYGIQRDDVGGKNNIEKFDKSKIDFFKSVLKFNKLNRAQYYQMINAVENVNFIIFRKRKQANDYLKNKKYLK